jgi:hypothetical protein
LSWHASSKSKSRSRSLCKLTSRASLYAGISAEEKLALALGKLVDSTAGADTSRVVRDLRARPETEALGQQIARWLQARGRDDAR